MSTSNTILNGILQDISGLTTAGHWLLSLDRQTAQGQDLSPEP